MTPGSDEFYMKMALAEAEKAAGRDEVPVGAVVVAAGTVIARAHNLTETLNDPTGCTLYVTVEPCVMCAGALAWSQVTTLVWGAPDPKKGFTTTGADILHPKTEVRTGVMAEECSAIMKKFFRKKRDNS